MVLTSVHGRRGNKITTQAFGLELLQYVADVFMQITQNMRDGKLVQAGELTLFQISPTKCVMALARLSL